MWWSLAGRIWLTTLAFVLLMAALGVLAISRLAFLESSVNRVLSRNYQSIKAANGMLAAVAGLRDGDLGAEASRSKFRHWLEIERSNLTEPGEGELVARIGRQADEFFSLASRQPAEARAAGSKELVSSLAELVTLNEHAMFSEDRRTVAVARRLKTEELAIAALAVLALGASGYLVSHTMTVRPLEQLTKTLRRIDDEKSLQAMAPPRTAELAVLAEEFNSMVERLQRGHRARLDELSRERSKTAAIIESVEDGLIVLDRTATIVHINEVASAILGLEPNGLLGASLESRAEDNPHVERLLAALGPGRPNGAAPIEFKVFLRGRDHTYITRKLAWTASGGEPLGAIVLLQDVTFIRDQERARTNLIATLSHELKTPLTSLTIGSELLAESAGGRLDPRQREILDTLRDAVARIQKLANDLLDASRSTAARIAIERRPIMLNQIVAEVARPLELQAREKEIRFELAGGDCPLPIYGDPIKLPWVVTNLVGNALRYTPAGGRITITVQRRAQVARIVVSDTGPGIVPALLGRIFEPYAQFPDHPARAGAAGLGLFIAKEIVEAHNGRIFVESEAGRGTSFTVEIPIQEEALG